MHDQAATLRLAVLPRSGLLTDALLVARRRGASSGSRRRSRSSSASRRCRSPARRSRVLLVGAALGSVLGAASLSLYLLLGIVGVPLYADHKHGWDVFSGATGGYIVGFVVAAALTGCARRARLGQAFSSSVDGDADRERRHLRLRRRLAAPLPRTSSWNTTLVDGVYPFVPGDLVKLYLAAAALPGAWALVRLRSRQLGGRSTANWSVISSVRVRKP